LGSDQHQLEAKGGDCGYHLWVAEQMGALLVRAISFIHPPQPQVFRQNVRGCIEDLGEGNHSALARAVCLYDSHFRNWMHHGLPQVQTLISVCFRLGIPPQRFLTERLGAGDPDWENARKIITDTGLRGPKRPTDAEVRRALRDALHSACPPALSELAAHLGFKRATALYRRDRSTCVRIAKVRIKLRAHTKVQSAAVSNAQAKNRLERALGEVPPPSADKVALELGLKHGSSLYRRFPILCRTLVVVRRNYTKLRRLRIEATLKSALAEDPPPTLKQIANRLGLRTPILLHQWFPNLCKLLAARRPEYHKKRLARIRIRLQAALKEDLAPLLQAIAARVGLDRSYLAMLFPDIWRRLRARSAEQRTRETKLRRETLRQEVREITQKLLKTGTPPTRRRVASMITESPIKFGPLLIPEIRKLEAEVRGQQVKL
jgi:hypothetical protein